MSEGGMEGRLGHLYSILRGAMFQGRLSNTWHIILFECGWNGGRLCSVLRGAVLQGRLSNMWHIILYERGRNGRPPV